MFHVLKVNTADLRYCVGVILSEGESSCDENLASTYKQHGFKEILLPAVDHSVWTTFPFKSTLSFFIGVARVYPRLAEYIQVLSSCNNARTYLIKLCLLGEEALCSPYD